MKKKILFCALLAAIFSLTAKADVAIPTGTKSIQANEAYNRFSIYILRSIYLADSSSHTMKLSAPTTLANDNYSFILPGADGTANQVLATDGSQNLSWESVLRPGLGQIVNADISPSAAIDNSKINFTGFVLPIAEGGTGQVTANAALNALLPSQVSQAGKTLTTNGTNASWSPPFSDPMTTTGDMIYSSDNLGTPARLPIGTGSQVIHGGTIPSYSAVSLTADVSGTLPVAHGGTGTTTSTGTGSVVLSTSPSLTTPALSTAALSGATTINEAVTITDTSDPTVTIAFNPAGTTGTHTTITGSQTSNQVFSLPNLTGTAALQPLTTGPVRSNGVQLSTGQTSLTSEVTGTLPISSGGTGVTSITTGVLHTNGTTVTGSPVILTSEVSGTLPVANGGTGTTTSTGSGSVVLNTSPTLVTPALGTPASGVLTNATGLPLTSGVTGTLPIANGGTNVTSVTTTPTATAFAGWDTNKNLSANSLIGGYTTTATTAGTTTLVVGSTQQQYFTGTTTQTVVLPVTSTLVLGQSYTVVNNSTGVVTVQSSGANTVQAMAASTSATFTVILTSGTTAASWNVDYTNNSSTGTVTSVALTTPAIFNVSGSPVTTSGTLALSYSGTALPIANGGTNATTKSAAFDSLSPMTTSGDTIYGGTSGTGTRLAAGSSTQLLHSGTTPSWSAVSLTADVSGTLPVANGGTGTTTSTGTGSVVLSTSPTLVTPALGTPSAVVLTSATGLPLTTGVTGTLPIANGGTNVTSVTVAPAATAFAGWDANKNLSANSFIDGYATTATTGATTTLVVGSAQQQYFTGSANQTVVLPVTSTLVLGQTYQIVNTGTGTVTVQSSGANTVKAMAASSSAVFTVILTSGTTAASWSTNYMSGSNITNPMTTTGDMIYASDNTGTAARLPIGGSTTVIHGGTIPTYSNVDLTADVGSSVLPIANGGTNSNSSLANNRFIVSNSSKIKETAAITANTVVVTDTNGLPISGTTTTTQVGYLAGATGTTGTTSTNVVFSTSPTLVTPALGTPSAAVLTNATGLPLTSGVTGTLPIANGGTNGTTKASGFDNLQPMTTAGDIIYGGTAGTGTRLAAGTSTQVLHSGTTPSYSAVSLTADVTGTLPVANGGTGVTSSTGTVAVVLSTSPTLVTPTIGVATATSVNFGGGALDTFIPWTAFTPSIAKNGGTGTFTSASVSSARYSQIGKIVSIELSVASVTITGVIGLQATLPVAAKSSIQRVFWAANGTQGAFRCTTAAAGTTLTISSSIDGAATFATGAAFDIAFTYEAN